jgi:hypothetical protein
MSYSYSSKMLMKIKEKGAWCEVEKVDGSKRRSDLFATFRGRRARQAKRPLTPGARGPLPRTSGTLSPRRGLTSPGDFHPPSNLAAPLGEG